MATHSSVLAWRIPGTGSLVGCHLWGRTELDMTEATWQQAAGCTTSPFSEEETEPQRGTLTWIGQNRELSRAGDLNSEPLVFQCCYMQGLNELSCAKVSATHAFGLFDVSSSRPFEWKLWADLASGQKS